MSTKTAVIYARVSSVGDRQNTDRQISDLLDYVEYQKLELCKIYEEHVSGAKKTQSDPSYSKQSNTVKQTVWAYF